MINDSEQGWKNTCCLFYNKFYFEVMSANKLYDCLIKIRDVYEIRLSISIVWNI